MARRHSPVSDEEKQVGHDAGLRSKLVSTSATVVESTSSSNGTCWRQIFLVLALPCLGLYYLAIQPYSSAYTARANAVVRPTGKVGGLGLAVCANVKPIGLDEFESRRAEVARLLSDTKHFKDNEEAWAAYIMEPGPNSLYYVNLTQSDWYLSERPWLLALSPTGHRTLQAGNPAWHLTVLTPTFELSRSQRLPFAVKHAKISKQVSWIAWDEAENPYDRLVQHLDNLRQNAVAGLSGKQHAIGDVSASPWSIYVEENVRQFIASGLEDAAAGLDARAGQSQEEADKATKTHDGGPRIRIGLASLEVRQQRMRKTAAELVIQRCAAKITIEALRHVRTQLRLGMTEKEGEKLITEALQSGGLTDVEVITLFGPNAALPHAQAGNKRLEDGEFALFDVTGSLHGYMSDMTRTMLPDIHPRGRFMKNSKDDSPPVQTWPNERARKIWETVHRAQEAALDALNKTEVAASDVDRAARDVISREGWAQYFTHRLGHGIGLQVHEAPYLNGGNTDEPLRAGETFSNEPGVYIEANSAGERGIGVRLEDMVLKTERGWELLSGEPLARSPWEP